MTKSTTTHDTYTIPKSDGAVEFLPEASTGEERIDLRLSSLARMTREAIDAAQSGHRADPNDIEGRRVEFGGKVIELFPPAVHREFDGANTEDMLTIGALLADFRTREQDIPRAA